MAVKGESYFCSDPRGRFLSPKCKAFCYTETVPKLLPKGQLLDTRYNPTCFTRTPMAFYRVIQYLRSSSDICSMA